MSTEKAARQDAEASGPAHAAGPRIDWRGRSVLVTGAGGFVGAWLCDTLLRRGAHVTALDNAPPRAGQAFDRLGLLRRLNWVPVDVTDFAALSGLPFLPGIEVVFHLAACTQTADAVRAPQRAFRVNILGTWNVLEAVRVSGSGALVVLASSDAVYGESREGLCTEDCPLLGSEPYAVSKICAELLTRSYAHAYGLRAGIARFSHVYGGGDANSNRLVPSAVASALSGEPPVLRSNGRARSDYLYVEDAVDGLLRLGAGPGRADVDGETYNFCSGQLSSAFEIAEMILRLAGRPDLHPRLPGGGGAGQGAKRLSADRAHSRLGWAAKTSLEEGLRRTLAWSCAETREFHSVHHGYRA